MPKLRGPRAAALAGLLLLGLVLLFWKLRILDTGVKLELTLENLDLYASHHPMTWFGFSALREGRLPLWNPWQFAGQPFLAAYYAGLFYPLNAIYLFTSVPLGIELSGVLHMLLGAAGMALLARRLRVGWPGALLAALSFVWSGWFVFSTNQPRILSALAWMPWTCWLVDRVLAGERRAWIALALGIGAQLLIGDAEHVLHGWLAASLLAALRMAQLAARGEARHALTRGALCAGALLAGAGLAAFQLFPTAELVAQSARSAVGFDARYAVSQGLITPRNFLLQAAQTRHWVTVGALPLVAALLALGRGRGALPWLLGAAAALLGAQMTFGGALFRLYHELPFADLFRRPYKFLDLYAFGQALLAGLALARLGDQVGLPRRRIWRDPRWLAALLAAALLAGFLYRTDRASPWLLALLAALAVYGAAPAGALRRAAVLGIAGVQLASLFFGSSNTYVRPVLRPETLAAQRELFPMLRARGDYARVYLSPRLWSVPGFSLKQGMLTGVGVSNDYEPLALERYAEYFGAVSPWRSPDGVFNGRYRLIGDPRWRLLDLTGTRFYAVHRREEAAFRMAHQPPGPDGAGFQKLADGEVQVFERAAALPRAWWVPEHRHARNPEVAISLLVSSGFDPRREVILEGGAAAERSPAREAPVPASELPAEPKVAIEAYAPERVELSVQAPRPGWLVLSDLYYPGWIAWVNGAPSPIERANHLFRAVRVGAGSSRVRFEYQPASLRRGALVSLASALGLAALGLRGARRRRAAV
jgi:hypothetical protein